MIGLRTGAALAALLAAAPAAAFVRASDPDTGKSLFWPLPLVPYEVNVDRPVTSPGAPGCAAGPAGDPALDAVRASFSAWNRSCADLELIYGGTTAETRTGAEAADENVVVFRRGWCGSIPSVVADPCYADPNVDCGGIYGCFEDHGAADRQIVALTSWLYDPGTGRIVDADIAVNGWDGTAGSLLTPAHGWYFTCGDPVGTNCNTYGQTGCDYIDLQNTVTHEAGHLVGLGHTGVPSTTMYENTAPGDFEKRTLSADDIAGVCSIYPQPTGCASAGAGAGALGILLAAAAVRRARRR